MFLGFAAGFGGVWGAAAEGPAGAEDFRVFLYAGAGLAIIGAALLFVEDAHIKQV